MPRQINELSNCHDCIGKISVVAYKNPCFVPITYLQTLNQSGLPGVYKYRFPFDQFHTREDSHVERLGSLNLVIRPPQSNETAISNTISVTSKLWNNRDAQSSCRAAINVHVNN